MSLFGTFTLLARSTRLAGNVQHLPSQYFFSQCYAPAVTTRAPSWAAISQSLRTWRSPRRVTANKVSSRPSNNSQGSSRESWTPPSNVVIYGIMGLNGIVFLAWQKGKNDIVCVRQLLATISILKAVSCTSKPTEITP